MSGVGVGGTGKIGRIDRQWLEQPGEAETKQKIGNTMRVPHLPMQKDVGGCNPGCDIVCRVVEGSRDHYLEGP